MPTQRPRYNLIVSCPTESGDLMVLIHARHKTKDTLRQAFQLAKAFVKDGQITSAEAWDEELHEMLASIPSPPVRRQVRRPTNQPTKNKPQTRKVGKKNVVQQDNNRRKPRKRS